MKVKTQTGMHNPNNANAIDEGKDGLSSNKVNISREKMKRDKTIAENYQNKLLLLF